MANRMRQLEERLEAIEERNRTIMETSTQPVEPAGVLEVWWPFMTALLDNEDAMFEKLTIHKNVVYDALALVGNVATETRGKKGAIHSNRERLLFLMIFLSRGVQVLELLVSRWIKTREHLLERVRKIANVFYGNLVGGTVRFFNETILEAPEVALIVDCTVVQIKRPK